MIELGRRYVDKITNFRGVATGHVDYLSGCNQTLLTPHVSREGNLIDAAWFDDQRLNLEKGSSKINLDNSEAVGFDKAAPVR